MRNQVIEYLKKQDLKRLALSDELPFQQSDEPLYIKKPKAIYVDNVQTEIEPIIQTLGAVNISNEVNTVSVFFSVDAKRLIAGYNELVDTIMNAKHRVNIQGVSRREATVQSEYSGDLLVTQIDIALTKLAN